MKYLTVKRPAVLQSGVVKSGMWHDMLLTKFLLTKGVKKPWYTRSKGGTPAETTEI